jgi:hypothetical protein
MPTELVVQAVHGGGMKFAATAGDEPVSLAYAMLKSGTPVAVSLLLLEG